MVPMARIGCAVLMMLCGATAAPACNDSLLSFVSWKIEPVDSQNNRVTTVFRSNAAKPIRMIDASAGYFDALGGRIATFNLDRDINLAPGSEYTDVKEWGPYTFERLLKLKPEEVVTDVCVRSVLFDDGTKEEFE